MTIGENIRKYRKEKGLTQKELSKLSGVHEIQLTRYENNKTVPNNGTIDKLANALNVNITELLGYDSKKESLTDELLSLFYCLNDNGKKKVIEHAEILTKVNEYKK